MTDLSVLIPARCEMFLARTIQDILENMRGDTEVIAVLDGAWADPPIPDHPKVTILHYPESIGQRAACNAAARLSTAKYVMKCDAHCAFDEGFDVKLMADMQDDFTMVPIMRNLHAFNWLCANGHRRYQGPSGVCLECGELTEREMVWIAKTNPQSTAYLFDTTLHFNYWGGFKKRPEGRGDLTETMSLQGSCFMLTREKYFELNICDESWGSWGNQGTEVACKTWLSGGRVIVNHKTWYGHMFRTSGGDFGFPWPASGKQIDHARKCSQDLFLNNKWEKQIYPLSWLIEKFKPVPFWHEESGKETLARITEAGETFFRKRATPPLIISGTNGTDAKGRTMGKITHRGQKMTARAMSLGSVDRGDGIGTTQVVNLQDQSEMERITTGFVIADNMVDNRDTNSVSHRDRFSEPSIHESMDSKNPIMSNGFSKTRKTNLPISIFVESSNPNPAFSEGISRIDLDSGEKPLDLLFGKSGDCEIIDFSHSMPPLQVSSRLESERENARSDLPIISQGIVYYTDSRLAPAILRACQRQLLKAAGGRRVICVSLQPMDFGENIVLPLERGYLAMYRQILAGLEALDTDVAFLAEHDVMYSPSHLDFIPPRQDVYYYNTAVWKVDYATGHALHYDCQQTSGLCAYRNLLLQHYRERVRRTEAKLAELGDSVEYRRYIRQVGHEPGTHGRAERVDDYEAESWKSEYPILDIRHDGNLTPTRWHKEQFRNQRFTQGWQEADSVPGWYEQGEWEQLFR